jgi:Leucine-rich repeat (LRR) protein
MEWYRYYIFFYWFPLFVTELNLACDESELSPIQFSVNTTTKKTDWKISTEADLTTLYVDSLNNTVLCKNLFDSFYKLNYLYIEAKNVEKIEADFLLGQQIYKCLVIANGRIKIIKQNTFSNLMVMVLGLHQNEISTIEREAFVNLSRLEEISLAENKITRLNPDSFVKLPHLNHFDVSNNRISKIQKEFFKFLKNESVLICLQDNAVGVLDGEAFAGSTTTNVQIDLRHNNIEFVPSGFFQGRHFESVDLTHNKISNFSRNFFRKKVDIKFLYLSFNPLEEETLEELTGWAKENNVSLSCSIDSDGHCLETSVVLLTASLIFIKYIV